jgi:hypothetical protein
MSNSTSLYSNTSSGNATVPVNNNTSLYNATGVPQTINNNISVTGNILAGGFISAAGNIIGANLVTTGNVYAGNIIGNIVGNIVLSGGNTEVLFNDNNTACSSPAFTFNSASNTLAVTGAVTATGNVSGLYILGNGSQLTGLPATYGNSNVTTLLAGFGSNVVSTTGNVTAGYFLGDGSQLTNLPAGNYSNANVANFLPTYSGAITANTVSATGNVTGLYILGDGSQLTNLPIPGVYGNTQVANFLAAFGSNVVSTTGNVTAGYFLGNGSQLTGLPATYSNANVVSLLAAFGSNTISTTGNVTVGYVLGDGSQLTNLPVQPGTYSNSNVAAYLPVYTGDYAGGNMSLTGNVTAAVLKTSGASGNITGVNYVSANFYLGDGGQLSNITSSYGNAQVATFLNAFGSNTISTTGNITTTANISGNYILGNGSQLTGLPSGYSNADVNSHLAAFGSNTISTTGNITAGYFVGNGSLLTDLTGANVTGQVANALVAGTVYTNAQPNITSVGTLSSLSVTGNVTAGNVNTNAVQATGSGGLALKNSAGTTQASLGAGGGDNFSISVSTNLNGNNAQIDISPTGTGHVHIKPTGTGAIEIAPTNTGSINNMIIGNVTPRAANVTTLGTTGNIAAAGILTDNYYYANGTPFTGGGGGTYSNANVQAFLPTYSGNIGNTASNVQINGVDANIVVSNDISLIIEGNAANSINLISQGANGVVALQARNITIGNTAAGLGTVTYYTQTINANNANITAGTGNITGGNILTAGLISATGNITAANLGNVSALNLNGNSSQVLYGNGVFAAVSGGSGSPGGANTQLQFNDGGAFAGNAAMTFNNTTGNITLGNIVVNTNQIETVAAIDVANVTAFGTTTPWRVLVGDGYLGSANSIYSATSPGTQGGVTGAARVLNADFVNYTNSGVRYVQQTNYIWAALTANISNANSRIQSTRNQLTLGGGASGNTFTVTNNTAIQALSNQIDIGRGTNANLSAVGNIALSNAVPVVSFNQISVAAGSSANIAVGVQSAITATANTGSGWGNVTSAACFYGSFTSGLANTSTAPTEKFASYYYPGANTSVNIFGSVGASLGSMVRNANVYHAFRNDDDLAKSKLGMLDSFHELNANTSTTTGTVNISKTSGQVQTIYPTGNVTIGSFTNFVTRVQRPDSVYVNAADTVTLIIEQGATPYTVTMPTGNAQIRYAGATSTVNATANTTVMISITGVYNYTTAANEYLVTISPEFS